MKKIALLLVSTAFLSSCSGVMREKHIITNTKTEHRGTTAISSNFNEKYTLYEVLTTDTIASVARKTNVSAEDIIRYNSLKKPYLLKRGEILRIPSVKSDEDDDLIDALDSLEDAQKSSQKYIQIAPRSK